MKRSIRNGSAGLDSESSEEEIKEANKAKELVENEKPKISNEIQRKNKQNKKLKYYGKIKRGQSPNRSKSPPKERSPRRRQAPKPVRSPERGKSPDKTQNTNKRKIPNKSQRMQNSIISKNTKTNTGLIDKPIEDEGNVEPDYSVEATSEDSLLIHGLETDWVELEMTGDTVFM